jgi:hypothetical protein
MYHLILIVVVVVVFVYSSFIVCSSFACSFVVRSLFVHLSIVRRSFIVSSFVHRSSFIFRRSWFIAHRSFVDCSSLSRLLLFVCRSLFVRLSP